MTGIIVSIAKKPRQEVEENPEATSYILIHLYPSLKTRYKCTRFKKGFAKVKKSLNYLTCLLFFLFFNLATLVLTVKSPFRGGWVVLNLPNASASGFSNLNL